MTALFPLHAGQEWTFDLTHARTSTALLLFVPTSRTEETPLPPLTVAVGARDAETGRVPVTLTRTVDGARVDEGLELWTDGGQVWMQQGEATVEAVTATGLGDRVVSTERVPCTLAFLCGLEGLCSPAPQGPLGLPVGPPLSATPSERTRQHAAATMVMGAVTAGLVMPVPDRHQLIAALRSYTSPSHPPDYPLYAAFIDRRAPGANVSVHELRALLAAHAAEAESVAAVLRHGSRLPDLEAVRVGLEALPREDRLAVVRALLRPQEGRHHWNLTLVAVGTQVGTSSSPRAVESTIAALGPSQAAEVAACLVRTTCPSLGASLANTPDSREWNQRVRSLAAPGVSVETSRGVALLASVEAQEAYVHGLFAALQRDAFAAHMRAMWPDLQPFVQEWCAVRVPEGVPAPTASD